MAISLLGRTLIARPKPILVPSIFPRSKFLSFSSPSSPRLVGAGVRLAVTELSLAPRLVAGSRCFSTRPTTSSLNDPSPNWNNRPPKETILLDGCDFEHWLIVLEKPEEGKTRDEIINDYIQTAASVIGSEEEARQKIYSVSTRHYFAFGVIVSEEQSYKFKDLPGVRWVLPDSYLDVRNKDYGGEPFINGEAAPYDPKYHEEWVRNNAKAHDRVRRNDRPRNFDRSRNFERRRENVQNRDFQSPPGNRGPPGPNMVGGPPTAPNMQAPLPNAGGIPHNANTRNTAPNMGGVPPHANAPNYAVPPNANVQSSAPNYGGNPPNANIQNNAPNYGNIPPNPNMQNSLPNYGGFPPRDAGYSNNVNMGNTVPNYGGMPPRDSNPNTGFSNPNVSSVSNGGYSNSMPNAGNTGNIDFQYRDVPNNGGIPPYQCREAPVTGPRDYQNSYAPNRNSGDMSSGNTYHQVRDIPGRDYQ